jgi:nucleotide-binding universal stress UspA family protein/predicted transcriptional regulator
VQKTLLVPLDGSEEGEASLPWATKLAQDRGLSLTLARVAEYPNYAAGGFDESMSVAVYEEVLEIEEDEAKKYLERVRQQLAETGLQVEAIMRDGRPAFTLLDLADELSAAAIVIASHGLGGFKRVVLGSVARQLVSHTSIPVFLVRATTAEHRREPSLNRLLVALDGSVLAESALDVAREVVAAGSTLVLVRIADTSAQGVPMATAYLDHIAASLRAAGVVVETQAIVGGSKSAVSRHLAEAAATLNVDAIVMSTHGRGGVSGWFVGSVADEVIRNADRPVLVASARAIGARATGRQHVRDVMTSDVMTLRDDESLVVALRKLVRRRASGAPVLDVEGRLVGVISQRDIMSWHEGAVKELSKQSILVPGEYLRRLQAERVRTVMTTSPTSIPESAPLPEAMALFRKRGIHRLPVTRNGRVVGIITGSDIVLTMLAQIESVAESSRSDELQPAAEILTSVASED